MIVEAGGEILTVLQCLTFCRSLGRTGSCRQLNVCVFICRFRVRRSEHVDFWDSGKVFEAVMLCGTYIMRVEGLNVSGLDVVTRGW